MRRPLGLATIIVTTLGTIAIIQQKSTFAILIPDTVIEEFMKRVSAHLAISGDNAYVAWWSNETANGNNDVMFRASTDGGQTFGEKINLSNSSDSDSTRVEIDSDGDSVAVSWWETNQTDDTPVMRISNDDGTTFGPVLKLAINGSLSTSGSSGSSGG